MKRIPVIGGTAHAVLSPSGQPGPWAPCRARNIPAWVEKMTEEVLGVDYIESQNGAEVFQLRGAEGWSLLVAVKEL